MREGRLGYNCENGRYGLLSMDLWIDRGFHCGECMEVLVDDQNLAEELEPLLFENHPTKDAQTVKKVAYYYAGKMIEKYRNTGMVVVYK